LNRCLILLFSLPILLGSQAHARGVTPYLPLDMDPQMERQIERVLLLADQTVLVRPIPAAAVLDALPRACETDAMLCAQVRRYLHSYMDSLGLTAFSIEGSSGDDSDAVMPNRHGQLRSSAWRAASALHWQPSDYLMVNLGGIAYEGDEAPTGSFVSLGFNRAQLDVGYRDHWLSPMTDSSLLFSTQATTTPSVTLSNYAPLTRFGLRYQMFLTRLSSSDLIESGDGFTSGRPKVLGMHWSIEPAYGWTLGVNRVMQFGGGARNGASFRDVLKAFVRPSSFDNTGPGANDDREFGNQLASITSSFIFPARTPFSVYFEYAGEDTSRGRSYLVGNSALSAGIHFPRLWRRFELTYEASEWQNGWYINHIYGDGLTNEGHVLGHWFGDQRAAGDAVGGQSHMIRIGWEPSFGGTMDLRLRTLSNESYSTVDYDRARDISLSYSHAFGDFSLGAEVSAARDVFGESDSRFGVFIRHGNFGPSAFDEARAPDGDTGAKLFVDAGVNVNEVTVDTGRNVPRTKTGYTVAPHFAIGARRAVSGRSDLGVRVEVDDIDGSLLLGFRALDYRYRFAGPLAIGAFIGAARYDLATPAYGIYGGMGAQWRDVFAGWDLGMDLRYASKVARDRLLPEDPADPRADLFYDVSSATLYLSRRF
jgi:hypothetical protein